MRDPISNDIQKALYMMEKQILGLLTANNIIEPGATSYATAQLTYEARLQLIDDLPSIDQQWYDMWLRLWPYKDRGNQSTIVPKLTKFLINYPQFSLDIIMQATEEWIALRGDKYCGSANNFFYKVNPVDKTIESRCAYMAQAIVDRASDQIVSNTEIISLDD